MDQNLPKTYSSNLFKIAAGLLLLPFLLLLLISVRQHPSRQYTPSTAPGRLQNNRLATIFTRGISLKGGTAGNKGTTTARRAVRPSASDDIGSVKQSDWFSIVKKGIEKKYYNISAGKQPGTYDGANLQQGLIAGFTPGSFTISPLKKSAGPAKDLQSGKNATGVVAANDWQLTLRFDGLYANGEAANLNDKGAVATQNDNDVEYGYGDRFAIQYHNDNSGVRQNFIVKKAPAENTRHLSVALRAQGDWVVNKVHNNELQFARRNGRGGLDRKIIYKDLKVWDAKGTPLLAKMEASRDGKFSVEVNTENAVYPVTIDPLITSAANTTYTGAGAATFLGISVASAGDVNGDGYSDVIIGASGADVNQNPPILPLTIGNAYIYMGSATGLSTTPAAVLTDNIVGDKFGVSVASAGDVNGDGYSDVIIGADQYSPTGGMRQGVVYIYEGGAGGISSSTLPTTTLFGSREDLDNFGYSVASAGDVNGDGFSDVIIGAPLFNSGQGQGYVYLGSAAGITTTDSSLVVSPIPADISYFGWSVAGIGDLNGDGYSDVIVGAPADNSYTGFAQVFEGSSTGVLTPVFGTYNGVNDYDALGTSVAGAGDVNGDGYADFLIGASGVNSGQGNALLYLGGTGTPASGGVVTSFYGGTKFGCSVASAGDVNGDGYADVVVGAYGYSGPAGYAFVFFGSATGISQTDTVSYTDGNDVDSLGYSVASAGDVNGDGYSDLIIGAPNTTISGNTHSGAVYVVQGGPKGTLLTPTTTTVGLASGSNFGFSVASAGDLNSDGYGDVVVGAYTDASGHGAAYVFLGTSSGLPTSANFTLSDPGGSASDAFGTSVSSAGDVNGDGYGDLVIGAPGTASLTGEAYVYFGSSSGLVSTSPSQSIPGTVAFGGFGAGVAGAGDVNDDGYKDVVIGAPSLSGNGSVYFYAGSAAGLVTSTPVVLPGTANLFGAAVAGGGDVNGDGYSDILVGSPGEGKVYVYHGASTGPATGANYFITGPSSVHFGLALSTAGDVNGDGYSDIIVGDYGFSSSAGAFYIYQGGSSGLSTSPAFSATGVAGSKLGTSVAGLSDVNGDGYSDVAVGAPGIGAGQTFIYTGSPSGIISAGLNATIPGIATGDKFGSGVAGAGDVNGDGYSDVMVGASTASSGDGAAYLFEGNNAIGHGGSNVLRLYETDLSTPIKADNISQTTFGLGLFVKPPYGHAKARLVWEVEGNGVPFRSGTGSTITTSVFSSAQGTYAPIPVGGTELKTLVTKVTGVPATKVRVRVEYAPTTFSAGAVYGPWIYAQALSTATSSGVILPLTWLSFTATVTGAQNVLLNWQTENEMNTQSFTVEHSIDAVSYTDIGTVAAQGTDVGVSSYNFTHYHPGSGTHYYRLKQVDIDGSFTYSKVVTAYIDPTAPTFSVYPNPATDHVTVTYTNSNLSMDVLRFINISGSVVKEVQINTNGASTTVPLTGMAPGVYFVQLASGAIAPKQIVIQ